MTRFRHRLFTDWTFPVKGWLASILLICIGLSLPQSVLAQTDKQSGVSPQVISLPSGPGSLEGLGESFQPNLSTGTASYPVSIAMPPGAGGFQPELSLIYNGGNANGAWGLGWKLNIPYIQRETDRGLPAYTMADTFIYSNAEKLMPVDDDDYRFETESSFMRFHWLSTEQAWEANTPDGTRYLFGLTPSAQIQIPYKGVTQIYRWWLERQIDPNGNEIRYVYQSFGEDHYTYLSEIHYNFNGHNNYSTLIQFHYEPRPDILVDRTSRAAINIGLRGTKIEMWVRGELVRTYLFGYSPEQSTGTHSLLTCITLEGSDNQTTLPPTRFTYTQYDPNTYQVVRMVNAPSSLGAIDEDAALIDMNYDGLPDLVFTIPQNRYRLYLNRGAGVWQSNYQDGPSQGQLSSPGVKLADMDGDGSVDLLTKTSATQMKYWTAAPGGLWDRQISYRQWTSPIFDLTSSNIRFVDVNNDKRIDVFTLNDAAYRIWLAPTDDRWSPDANFAGSAHGFSDTSSNLRFADFTGDRLLDLVELRRNSITYLPHKGDDQFDSRIGLGNAPRLQNGENVDDLQLGDLNNDGLADVILPDSRQVSYWLNKGDNSFTARINIPNQGTNNFPVLNTRTTVNLADMDGDGALELLYSQADGSFEYIDFFTGPQPNLLTGIDNGLGRSYEIHYKSSTDDYIADQGTANAWKTTIPFPVQVVSQVTVHDANSGAAYVTDYHYRNGYYDGEQKEFRGFAEVIETQHGDESAPTMVTHYFYDVGDKIESRKGLLYAQQITDEDADCSQPESGCYQQITNTLATYEVATGVHFSTITRTHTFLYEATSQPVQLLQSFAYDSFGNQTENFNFGQVCSTPNGALDIACGNDELLQYTSYAINPERWIVNTPAVITQTDAVGNVVSLAHLYYDGTPYVGLPLHSVERGDLTRQEESLGPLGNNRFIPTQRQAFDKYGNVIGIKDANDHLTTISYDDLTHTFPVTERIHLDTGRTLTYTAAYDIGFGKIISATEFNGNTTRFTYDPFGRIASIILPGDTLELPTQQFSYNLGSPRSSITTGQREESGTDHVHTSVVYFDGLGRKLQTRSEAEYGRVVVAEAMTFNARQSEHEQFLPYFADDFAYELPDIALPHTNKEYDPLGRVISTTNPDGTFATVSFQPLLQIQADEEDNHLGSPHQDTPKTLRYDGLERLVEVVERNRVSDTVESYHTHYQYDTLSNLTRITDAQNNIKTMQYDALSRKTFMDDPDRGVMYYTYDDVGNLRQTIDGKSQVITYTYDAANRPLTETWFTADLGARTVFTYHYDSYLSPLHPDAHNTLGQVTYIEDPEGAVYFSYDSRGNVAGRIRSFSQEGLSFVTRMRYDAMDRLSGLTYPDGYTVTYGYNAQGLLETIPGYVANVDYTPAAQRTGITYTNGVTTRYGYDNRLRLDHLQSGAGQNILQDLGYSFDQTSNIVAITDSRPQRTPVNDQTQDYSYDSLYRLTQASGTYGQIDYAYNSIGNMIHQSSTISDTRLNQGVMRHGENGAGPHALTFAGGDVYGYDDNGNRLGKGNTTYSWNARDWLVAVTGEETASVYAYDSARQRIRQTVSEGEVITTTLYPDRYAEVRGDQFVRYILDNQQRIAQIRTIFDSTNLLRGFSDSVTMNFTITQLVVSDAIWHLTDHIGSTNFLIDKRGQLVSEATYNPYGTTRYELDGRKMYYQFTGKELDESGLYYYDSRYYDALMGRFINPDPLYMENPDYGAKNPCLLNIYTYANNNPIRFLDTNGEEPVDSSKVKRGGVVEQGSGTPDRLTKRIVIDITNKTFFVIEKKTDKIIFEADVILGSKETPTPQGKFHAGNWVRDYVTPKWGWQSDTPWSKTLLGGNAFGPFQLPLFEKPGYFIHGTMGPGWASLKWGQMLVSPESHGCIRMCNPDIQQLHDEILKNPRGIEIEIKKSVKDQQEQK